MPISSIAAMTGAGGAAPAVSTDTPLGRPAFISGGENISTIEVESVLFKHPAILEAAVVARPDSHWGETPCAFVTLKTGKTATAEEIIAFCRANMAHFKAPKTIIFSDLPKTSTGKIQKFALREKAKNL